MSRTKIKPEPSSFAGLSEKKISLQEKLAAGRAAMKKTLVERDEEIDLCLTALIAQEHCLLVGQPGTAKSLLAETIRTWITGSKSLVIHCCKDTQRSTTFGPIDIPALKERKIARVLDGGAADVEIVCLEEVFKAGPAVLDSFLLLMNERIYKEGLVSTKALLRFLLGTSNEWSPEGCEAALSAFFDRFLFRKEVNPVSKKGRMEIRRKAALNDDCKTVFPYPLSLEEVDRAHQECKTLPISGDAKKAISKIDDELTKEGILFSDRRNHKIIKTVRASAYLDGASQVLPEHCEVLKHVLWLDPTEQAKKCKQIVSKICNPIGTEVNSLLNQADDLVEKVTSKAEAIKAVVELEQIEAKLQRFGDDLRAVRGLDQVAEHIENLNKNVISRHSAFLGDTNKEE